MVRLFVRVAPATVRLFLFLRWSDLSHSMAAVEVETIDIDAVKASVHKGQHCS
jgi:hypothetical protein